MHRSILGAIQRGFRGASACRPKSVRRGTHFRRLASEPLEQRTVLSVIGLGELSDVPASRMATDPWPPPAEYDEWPSSGNNVYPSMLSDALPMPPEAMAELEQASLGTHAEQGAAAAGTRPYGAGQYDTSEYMIGKVYVSVVLFESDGSIDAQSENWTTAERNQVSSKICDGAQWWEDMFGYHTGPGQELDFLIDTTYLANPVATGYEPIKRPYTDQALWIEDFLETVGYDTGSYWWDVKRWNDHQRTVNEADWAYTVFVVDSSNDSDGEFSGGHSAYAYLGGPFVVMTYDNDGWGIGNMDMVFAHETGHIFYALDEYASGDPNNPNSYYDHSGYYNTQNLNAVDDNPDPGNRVFSIMAEVVLQNFAWWAYTSSPTSLQMIGWRDSDGDGLSDVVDVPLTLTGSGSYNPLTGNYEFLGKSCPQTLDNQNPKGYGHDITINAVSRIQYRVDGGGWVDGNSYGGRAETDVSQDVAVVGPGTHTIDFRTRCDSPRVYSPIWSDTFDVMITSITSYAFPGGVVLRIEDNAPGGQDETLAITVSGANLVITSEDVILQAVLPVGTQVNEYRVEVPMSYFHRIEVLGKGGADTFTVDLGGDGIPIPAAGLTFDGGADSDKLKIANASLDRLEYEVGQDKLLLNDTFEIEFTGLEPIDVTSSVGTVIIEVDDTADNTTEFTADGARTKVTTGAFEAMTFPNPSAELIVNGDDDNNDTIVFTGLGAGFGAAITVDGKGGNDSYKLPLLGLAVDINDPDGDDTLDFSGAARGIMLDLNKAAGQVQLIAAGNRLTITGTIETCIGSEYLDLITANSAGSRLEGRGGNDVLYGGVGDDQLVGGDGNDILFGRAGNDLLEGNDGDDRLFGDAGNDLLRGNDGSDYLYGDAGNDILLGGGGNDQLYGGGDRNILIGGLGSDCLCGGFSDDLLIGGTTVHDADDAALLAIVAEWAQPTPIDERIDHLQNGGGLNGTHYLNPGIEVFDDATQDMLYGMGGQNWFLSDPGDLFVGRRSTDR